MNRVAFAPDEWYHCYSRGVDKRKVFENKDDYQRFLDLLFVSNSTNRLHRSDMLFKNPEDLFSIERGGQLVSIGAYCLMPNHFHIVLKDSSEEGGGISRFMQKLGTAYTMYFNKKRERVGNLFVKPFRSRHVKDQRYLQRVIPYVHFNPIELYEPGWKEGKVVNLPLLEKKILSYTYSSLLDYEQAERRPERAILDENVMSLTRDTDSLKYLLADMHEYYKDLAP